MPCQCGRSLALRGRLVEFGSTDEGVLPNGDYEPGIVTATSFEYVLSTLFASTAVTA